MPGPDFTKLADLVNAVTRGAASLGDSPMGTPMRLWEETRAWVARFVGSATGKWLPAYAAARPCSTPEIREGVPFPCSNHAIGVCSACGKPTCLHHAFVDQYAELVCYPCIVKTIRMGHAERMANGEAAPGHQAPPPPPPAAVKRERARRALEVLGLQPGASWPEIRKKHRSLAAKHHPDRVRGAQARANANALCAAVNAALADLEFVEYKPEDR